MIQGLLGDHGIPSLVKRPFSFGNSYAVLGGGPHQVFVPEDVAEAAREVLEGGPGSD